MKKKLYEDKYTVCPDCHSANPIRYVYNNACVHCILKSYSALKLTVDSTKYDLQERVCTNGAHLQLILRGTNKCVSCLKESTPRQQAIKSGKTRYTPTTPCPVCNTYAPRRVNNGQCDGCHPPRTETPRQQAIRTGDSHYTPTTPCPVCNTHAPRRVNNSQCSGCHPPRTESPRQRARRLGKQWYMPTTPCKYCNKTAKKHITGLCTGCP